MARLNISISDDLYKRVHKWRGSMNLSDICSKALKDEIDAAESERSGEKLLSQLNESDSYIEKSLKGTYGLSEVHVCQISNDECDLREDIGRLCAKFIDSNLCDNTLFALGGGRQMWCAVRNLSRRKVEATITAMGVNANDPIALHTHPNTLVTLCTLLYSPRTNAHLVGSTKFNSMWCRELEDPMYRHRIIIASCSSYQEDSPFSHLLPSKLVKKLGKLGVVGDYGYMYFDGRGKPFKPDYDCSHSVLSPQFFEDFSREKDTKVVLVAGGASKVNIIRSVLEHSLCNILITDEETAVNLA